MPAVRSAVDRAGLEHHVRFFGLHPAVERVLPHTDVLLLTSRAESFCLAALEAAACGVPAVGPRLGGLPEVIAHGESGLLYEAGNERDAAAAMLRLLGDRDDLARMRAEAVRGAARFSGDAVVPRYERLYRRLLADGDPRPTPSSSGRS
jgi:glycosyltransferase involved in cell wall biosynthesis